MYVCTHTCLNQKKLQNWKKLRVRLEYLTDRCKKEVQKRVADSAFALSQSIVYKIEFLTHFLSIFVLNIRDLTMQGTGTGPLFMNQS